MLTEKRKMDRAIMAARLEAVALRYGAMVTYEHEGEDSYRKRRLSLFIEAARGLACHVDFDGQSCQPDVFVIPWHFTTYGDDTRLHPHFGWAAGGSINSCHGRKCTAVARGFDNLLAQMESALKMIQTGAAFDQVSKVTN